MPKNLLSIRETAFNGCSKLSQFTVDEGNLFFVSVSGSLYDKSMTRLIKLSVKESGDIIIPDTVTSIDEDALCGCDTESLSVPFVGKNANDISTQYLGSVFGASSYSKNDEYVPTSLKNLTIGNKSTVIVANALSGCSSLEEITLENGITEIRGNAFKGCSSLKKITIPSSVETFGLNLFEGCDNVVIHCAFNSPAHIYAIENGIKVSLTDGDVGGESPSITPLPKTDTVLYTDSEHIVLDVSTKTSLYGKVLIVAVYDKDGNLLDLMNFPQVRSVTSAYIALPMSESAGKIKIFLWDSASSIVPEGVCEELKIENAIEIVK